MNMLLFVMLVLILSEASNARKAAESFRQPRPRETRKPWFTPGAPWWEHVLEAIGILIGFAITVAVVIFLLML
jgi:hypothetical protein